jgi:hypothetical protein
MLGSSDVVSGVGEIGGFDILTNVLVVQQSLGFTTQASGLLI